MNGQVIAKGQTCSMRCAWAFAALWLSCAWAQAQTVDVPQAMVRPGKTISVGGTGFGAKELVDIYLDSQDLLLGATGRDGSFAGYAMQLPPSALPGTHWVTVVGRRSGTSATAAVTVGVQMRAKHFDTGSTSFNPFENVISPQNVSSLSRVWTASIPAFTFESTPLVVDGLVYLNADDYTLYAFAARTGNLVWKVSTFGYTGDTLHVADGVLYAPENGDDVGFLSAVDAKTGTRRWMAWMGVGTTVGMPVVVNGLVHVFCGSATASTLVALDAKTGREQWRKAVDYPSGNAPAVVNGVVYFGGAGGRLQAFSAATGALLWATEVGRIDLPTTVAKGVIYTLDAAAKQLSAVTAATGQRLWTVPVWASDTSIAVAEGKVYLACDASLCALDAATGATLWMSPTGEYRRRFTVANGVVYGGGINNTLRAYDAKTGSLLASFSRPYGAPNDGQLAVVNGMVYMSTMQSLDAYALPGNQGLADLDSARPPKAASLRPDLHLRLAPQAVAPARTTH